MTVQKWRERNRTWDS